MNELEGSSRKLKKVSIPKDNIAMIFTKGKVILDGLPLDATFVGCIEGEYRYNFVFEHEDWDKLSPQDDIPEIDVIIRDLRKEELEELQKVLLSDDEKSIKDILREQEVNS